MIKILENQQKTLFARISTVSWGSARLLSILVFTMLVILELTGVHSIPLDRVPGSRCGSKTHWVGEA